MDAFAALAEPTRRQILGELRRSSRSVNELAEALDVRQPTMSKHLKVLLDAGFVSRRGSAQQRIYQLEQEPFARLEAWLEPFIRFWESHLDALERHLDRTETRHGLEEPLPTVAAPRRRQRSPRR